jgi:hypothetical protein
MNPAGPRIAPEGQLVEKVDCSDAQIEEGMRVTTWRFWKVFQLARRVAGRESRNGLPILDQSIF